MQKGDTWIYIWIYNLSLTQSQFLPRWGRHQLAATAGRVHVWHVQRGPAVNISMKRQSWQWHQLWCPPKSRQSTEDNPVSSGAKIILPTESSCNSFDEAGLVVARRCSISDRGYMRHQFWRGCISRIEEAKQYCCSTIQLITTLWTHSIRHNLICFALQARHWCNFCRKNQAVLLSLQRSAPKHDYP